MRGREFGLEDPELQVPNRPQIPNCKLWRRLRFSNNVDAFRAVMLSGAKHLGSRLREKQILRSAQDGDWVVELLWMLELGFGA
jgi:hypothetical protein